MQFCINVTTNNAYLPLCIQAEKAKEEALLAGMSPDDRQKYLANKALAAQHDHAKVAHYSKVNAVYFKSSGANIAMSSLTPRDSGAAAAAAAPPSDKPVLAALSPESSPPVEEKKGGGGCVVS